MLNCEPITLKQIQDLVKIIEPKTIYMNKKTYDSVLELLDFKPSNIIVHNFIPDNQAIVLNEMQKENMNKGFFPIRNI